MSGASLGLEYRLHRASKSSESCEVLRITLASTETEAVAGALETAVTSSFMVATRTAAASTSFVAVVAETASEVASGVAAAGTTSRIAAEVEASSLQLHHRAGLVAA